MAQMEMASMSGSRERWRAFNPVRRLLKLTGLSVLAGLLLLLALSMFENQYGSEARLQLETTGKGVQPITDQLAAPLIASQIEVLRSQELAAKVVERNQLINDPEFNRTLGRLSPFESLAVAVGLIPDPYMVPINEQVVRNFRSKLTVVRVPDSHLIEIGFRAEDPDKAARIVNDLAAIYIDWLGTPGKAVSSNNTGSLNARIAKLQETIRDNEDKLSRLVAEQRFAKDSEILVAVDPGKLGELQGELILARAKRMETEKRSALIREMLRRGEDLQRSPELFQTGLIRRLLDRQLRLQRKIDDLSATLLPSHPQMKRLMNELASLQIEVRREAGKVAISLDNDIKITEARERSLQESLDRLRQNPVPAEPAKNGNSIAIEKLRRVLASNRQQLAESEARLDTINVLSDTERPHLHATLIVPASANHTAVFPKRRPIVLTGMLVVFLGGFAYLLIKAMLGWPRVERRKGERRRAPRPPADEAASIKPAPVARVMPPSASVQEKMAPIASEPIAPDVKPKIVKPKIIAPEVKTA